MKSGKFDFISTEVKVKYFYFLVIIIWCIKIVTLSLIYQKTKQMSTSSTQYKIEFTDITIDGNRKASTIWMNSLEEVNTSKYITALDAEIITREKPKSTLTFAQWKATRN